MLLYILSAWVVNKIQWSDYPLGASMKWVWFLCLVPWVIIPDKTPAVADLEQEHVQYGHDELFL